jgi:hypothetical protein
MEFVALDILPPPMMKSLADSFANDMFVKIVKPGLDDDQLQICNILKPFECHCFI